MKVKTKQDYRKRRHMRLRGKVIGTAERPRMSVYISNKHMYVQFIDDAAERTLATASSKTGEMAGVKNDVALARQLGMASAEALKGLGIEQVVFDRGGFSYSGRVKALAEAAREAGLKF